ncbi:hypothetical protein BDN67DRAFT_965567 [Paxillus ammoniavirescens]|nr:hypothetical protein BDN67DRAFT_965567 [Paxillus ammoniavirescens]
MKLTSPSALSSSSSSTKSSGTDTQHPPPCHPRTSYAPPSPGPLRTHVYRSYS